MTHRQAPGPHLRHGAHPSRTMRGSGAGVAGTAAWRGRLRGSRVLVACAATMLAASTASSRAAAIDPAWPDTVNSRLEALALLETLNADLLGHDSATLTLDRWCEAHRLASPARVVADLVRGVQKAPAQDVQQLLGVGPKQIRYRRVRLRCGDHVLSEADNWYVPSRLTPEMNHILETTDTAFGRAVQALHFHRRTLAATLLWSPLPRGWEMGATLPSSHAGALKVPAHVIEHRALLSLPDGRPFSAVVETYTSEVLDFPPPQIGAPGKHAHR